MYNPIRPIESVSRYVPFDGFKDLLERLEIKVTEIDQREGKNPRINLEFEGQNYSLIQKSESSGHMKGDGGRSEDIIFLSKNGNKFLSSRRFSSYHTYSDDFFDFPNRVKKDTYLLGMDRLAIILFGEIKTYSKNEQKTS